MPVLWSASEQLFPFGSMEFEDRRESREPWLHCNRHWEQFKMAFGVLALTLYSRKLQLHLNSDRSFQFGPELRRIS